MKFEWPWISRKEHKAIIEAEIAISRSEAANQIEKNEKEWAKKFEPVLKDMIQIRARSDHNFRTFQLNVAFDQMMLEQVAMYNDSTIWGYIAEQMGYEVQRQLATLNFAGLHRMARDSEYRYRDYPSVSALPR